MAQLLVSLSSSHSVSRYSVHTMEPVKSSIIFIPKPIGGMDFLNMSIDLTFNTSSPIQTVMVAILDDMVPEDIENFSLVLMSTDHAVTLNPVTANISILDDIDCTLKRCLEINSAIRFLYHILQ